MDWTALWEAAGDWLGKALLVLLGAVVALLSSVVTDRRASRREAAERDERARQRRYELGRDAANEALNQAREAWTVLANRPFGSGTAPVDRRIANTIRLKAALIPDEVLRRAGDALYRLLVDPGVFEKRDGFASFELPKGPAGNPPTLVKQILAVETYENMLTAYLREEDPADFSNPLMDTVMREGAGMGLTVSSLYDQR